MAFERPDERSGASVRGATESPPFGEDDGQRRRASHRYPPLKFEEATYVRPLPVTSPTVELGSFPLRLTTQTLRFLGENNPCWPMSTTTRPSPNPFP